MLFFYVFPIIIIDIRSDWWALKPFPWRS